MQIQIIGDITPKTLTDIADQLKEYKDGEEVTVQIDTLGGWLEVALDICVLLKNLKAKGSAIVTENIGDVISAGTFIYLMGDRRIWNAENGDFLIHKTSAAVSGNSDELNNEAEKLGDIDASLAELYAAASGIDKDVVLSIMELSQPLTPEAVSAFGFCTELNN